jgi:hypothetical protein
MKTEQEQAREFFQKLSKLCEDYRASITPGDHCIKIWVGDSLFETSSGSGAQIYQVSTRLFPMECPTDAD